MKILRKTFAIAMILVTLFSIFFTPTFDSAREYLVADNSSGELFSVAVNNSEITISTKDETYTIPQGHHDGSGKVSIASAEQAKITATNIRAGITILGVTGTMSTTEGAKPQAKTVTPTTAQQVIVPDAGYNYLSQVTVNKIPYVESDNSAGGITVTIA